jgi:fermentation-respiration switch protein FrsA (DUF1100 family)
MRIIYRKQPVLTVIVASQPELIPHVIPALKHFIFLCHQIWPSYLEIRAIRRTPVLFLSGMKDELVPPAHMKKLFESCETGGAKYWKEFEEGTHNDTCIKVWQHFDCYLTW